VRREPCHPRAASFAAPPKDPDVPAEQREAERVPAPQAEEHKREMRPSKICSRHLLPAQSLLPPVPQVNG